MNIIVNLRNFRSQAMPSLVNINHQPAMRSQNKLVFIHHSLTLPNLVA